VLEYDICVFLNWRMQIATTRSRQRPPLLVLPNVAIPVLVIPARYAVGKTECSFTIVVHHPRRTSLLSGAGCTKGASRTFFYPLVSFPLNSRVFPGMIVSRVRFIRRLTFQAASQSRNVHQSARPIIMGSLGRSTGSNVVRIFCTWFLSVFLTSLPRRVW